MGNEVTKIALAIIGVAILAVLVSSQNKTGSVLGSAFSGFSGVLGTAMGKAAGNTYGSPTMG